MFKKKIVADLPSNKKRASGPHNVSNYSVISKRKIWVVLLWIFNALSVAALVTLAVIGNADRVKYTINADQNSKVNELQHVSNFAIKAFQKCKDEPGLNTPINDVIQYLVDFKYIPNAEWSGSIDIANFNNAVDEYRQWPQSSNPDNPLQTKDKYLESISSLSQAIQNNAANIPELDKVDMQNFIHWLNQIDMTVYSDIDSYTNARLMEILYPSLISFAIIFASATYYAISRWLALKRIAAEAYDES